MRLLTLVNDRDKEFQLLFITADEEALFLRWLEDTPVGVRDSVAIENAVVAATPRHIHQWEYSKDYETGSVTRSCLDPACDRIETSFQVRD